MHLGRHSLAALCALQDARARARQLVNDHTGRLRARTWHATGLLRGKAPATLRFTGTRAALDETVRLFFLGDARLQDLAPTAEPPDLEVREGFGDDPPPGFLVVQPWLNARCRPGNDYAEHAKLRVSETLCQAARKAERRGLSLTSSTDLAELPAFYERLFLPYVRGRFGGASLIAPLGYLASHQNRMSQLEILHVQRGAEIVAGALVVAHRLRPELTLLAYGGTPAALGDRALREQWIALVNAQVLKRACDERREVDYGLTAPFLDDGVFMYKRRWGCVLEPARGVTRLLVRLNPMKTHALLSLAPMFHVDRGALVARAARVECTEAADQALLRTLQLATFGGLHRLELFDQTNGALPVALSTRLTERGIALSHVRVAPERSTSMTESPATRIEAAPAL